MMKKNKSNLIQNTKSLIIKTASSLFADNGYLGVSMDDIARKLNITKAALYYYFTGKEELFCSVLDDTFLTIQNEIDLVNVDKKPADVLMEIITVYLDFGVREKSFVKLLLPKISLENKDILERVFKIKKWLEKKIKCSLKEINTDYKKKELEIDTVIIVSMLEGLLLENSIANVKFDAKVLAQRIVLLVVGV